jgi:hypothetical protein
MIAPAAGYTRIIPGSFPQFGEVVCPTRLFCSLKEISVLCHKDITDHSCPSLITRWLQREWLRAKDNRVEAGMPSFSLVYLIRVPI